MHVNMIQLWMIELTFIILYASIGAAHRPQWLPPACPRGSEAVSHFLDSRP